MPRVRFGQIHIVNNLFDSKQADYCVRGGVEADIFVESNAFIGVRNPVDIGEPSAKITVKNNITTGSKVNITGQGAATIPTYKIDVIDASLIEALVKKCAGATLTGPTVCSSCSVIKQ